MSHYKIVFSFWVSSFNRNFVIIIIEKFADHYTQPQILLCNGPKRDILGKIHLCWFRFNNANHGLVNSYTNHPYHRIFHLKKMETSSIWIWSWDNGKICGVNWCTHVSNRFVTLIRIEQKIAQASIVESHYELPIFEKNLQFFCFHCPSKMTPFYVC